MSGEGEENKVEEKKGAGEKGTVEKEAGEKKVLTILLTKGPYTSEASDLALKTALAAKRMGYEVNVFIYLDGAWNTHITDEKDFNNPGEWLRSVVKRGINIGVCERCSGARDLKEENMVDGVPITGSYYFIDMLMKSDKVMTFGG
jgi:tRNA 2-thiouridine synthesizing protein D